MQRVFTKNHGKYQRGEVRDYPVGTWRTFFAGYERYTLLAEEGKVLDLGEPRAARRSEK